MGTNDNDTDPSTPSARRSTEAAEAGLGPASERWLPQPRGLNDTQPLALPHPGTPAAAARPSTHPGLGPPPGLEGQPPAPHVPPEAPPRPMGIVVPVAPPDAKKDSVELLLDGITGPQPERTKTMPQTDGQAAAAYHARHDVRPARTSPDDEPKVVVERPVLPPTIRIDRSRMPAPDAAASRAAADATAVTPPQMGPRVVVAVVAGLMVVLGLFVAARFAIQRRGDAPAHATATATAASAVVTAAAPSPPPAAAPATPVVSPEVESAAPPAPVSVAAGAAPAASPPPAAPAETAPAASPRAMAPPPKAKPRAPSPAAAAPSDLGELKTTFH